MRARIEVPLIAVIVVCAAIALWWVRGALQWGFRRELPWSARDVHEAVWEEGFLPDYEYCLKARITRAELDVYARHFGLTPETPGRVYDDDDSWADLACPPGPHPWWTPPPGRDGWLVGQSGDTWTTAVYHDGYLYLSSVNH